MHILTCYVCLILVTFLQIVVSCVLFFVPRGLWRRRKNISGQKVLITGAGSGLGRQLALEFSRRSVVLVLVDIDEPSLLETKNLLDSRSKAFLYECDVSDYAKVCEMAKRVREDVGDVEILVNNAGVVSGKYLTELTEEDITRTMRINALAHFWTCKAFLPAMMEQNRGHLVSIVSIVGKSGCPRLADYCASKFAATGFAEALEFEMRALGLDGIKVTIVLPYFMRTGLFTGANPLMGDSLTPERVAKEVIRGVLEEEETLYVPRFFLYAAMVKETYPRWLVITLSKITGVIRAMDNFTGRQSNGTHSANNIMKTY